MPTVLTGIVKKGYGAAGRNLAPVLHLIEARSSIRPLIPNTLNLELSARYPVLPDFVVKKEEYFWTSLISRLQ